MKTITIKNIPDDVENLSFIKFALVYIERHLRAKKEAEIGNPNDLIKEEFNAIKTANGITEEQIEP